MTCARLIRLVSLSLSLAVSATPAAAEDISGTLSVTKVIVDDSRLVGDVTCTMTTAPCIQFGAPNVALRLNGYTITGPANPDDTTTCNPTPGAPASDGISNGTSAATSQTGVSLRGLCLSGTLPIRACLRVAGPVS